jgi:peptidoglycan hydrolase CwlO-like protein
MPTQEERLETVEYNLKQFKTETIKAYGDMAFEMTIIKGLIENAIGRLTTLSNTTEKYFERVNIRLDAMDAHLNFLQESANKTDKRFDAIEAQLTKTDERLDSVETQLTEHKTLLTQILARLPEKP